MDIARTIVLQQPICKHWFLHFFFVLLFCAMARAIVTVDRAIGFGSKFSFVLCCCYEIPGK